MEWFVLAIGLVALATAAAMIGRAHNSGENSNKEMAAQPGQQESRISQQPTSPDRVPPNGSRVSRASVAGLRTGWEDWRWEPANLHRPALLSTVTPDTTVLLKGARVTVPVTLPRPWIIGTALPLSPPPVWLSSLSTAASQTGNLLLWPWRAGNRNLPEQFAILVPVRKLSRLSSNPEDPRLSLSSLVILDLRLGLPRRLSRSADDKVSRRSQSSSGTEDTLQQQQLAQIAENLRSWSGGVPILAGMPATSKLDLELDMLASAGFDGVVVFASPLAAGLPLPLSASEVGLPLARAIATARATRVRRGLTDWPLLVAGPIATPADCLKAVALGAAAAILDATLAWPELCTYREQDQQAREQAETEVDDVLAATFAELLTNFTRETESLLRILGCRRLSELTPQLLTCVGNTPGPHEQHDYVPSSTVAATPPALPPRLTAAAMPATPVPPTLGAADTDRTSNREFVRPRLLTPRPPRRIRVLTRE